MTSKALTFLVLFLTLAISTAFGAVRELRSIPAGASDNVFKSQTRANFSIADDNFQWLSDNIGAGGLIVNPSWSTITGKPTFNALATSDLSGCEVNDFIQITSVGVACTSVPVATGTIPNASTTGHTLIWNAGSWSSGSFAFNMSNLSDLKIGGANLIDDTATNGATTRLWSADKVYDQLAGKVSLSSINTRAGFEATVGWTLPEGGTGSLSLTESATDPDVATMEEGDMIVSRASGDLFYKSGTGSYIFAGTYTATPAPPVGGYCSAYTGDSHTLFCEDFETSSTKVWTNNGWGSATYDTTTLASRSMKLVYGTAAANLAVASANRPNLSLNQQVGYEIKYRVACGNATNNFKMSVNYYGQWIVPTTCGVDETKTGTFSASNDSDMLQIDSVTSMATGNTYYIDSIRLYTPQ